MNLNYDRTIRALCAMSTESRLDLFRNLAPADPQALEAWEDDDLCFLYKVITLPYFGALMDIQYMGTGLVSDADCTWIDTTYWKVDEIQSRRYRERNEGAVRKMFRDHFEGKDWTDIDRDLWAEYSDFHKDVFGYRPHGIVCGVYINPNQW